jgi:hydrogenase/urease accessory protein HupE
MKTLSLILGIMLFGRMAAPAHEMRPALLQIRQTAKDTYDITWKIPRRENMVIRLAPVFPNWFRAGDAGVSRASGDGALYHYRAVAGRDVHRMAIRIEGIETSLVDVLIYVELMNGEKYSLMAQPTRPVVVIPQEESFVDTARAYTSLGIKHILLGPDHLLFVLALLLIVSGTRRIVWTITAFTIAHSLTLSLSVLGFIGLPAPPVEACIALSIMFLASEMLKLNRGEKVISAKKPWLVSFSFGLLHGLGFASALHEVGLPQTQVPAALAFFNAGVELGQLAFVFFVLLILKTVRKFLPVPGSWAKIPAYAIGSVAAFWLIDRVAGFWN